MFSSSNSQYDSHLYHELCTWRTKTAEESQVAPYFVVQNTVIDNIVTLKPLTLKELKAVPGIGPVKLKSFGESLVRIVRECTSLIDSSSEITFDSKSSFNTNTDLVTKTNITPKTRKTPISRVKMADKPLTLNDDDSFISENELNHEQRLAASHALKGNNVFITGSAGTGKTFLMKYVIQQLMKIHGESAVAVTAPTGIAAIAVGGQTIHSFAGIGLGEYICYLLVCLVNVFSIQTTGKDDKQKLLSKVVGNKQSVSRWRRSKVLVIDEVSMLDKDLFELLDEVARKVRGSSKPFGGLQLLLVGDFMQLPPVKKGDGHFAFQSRAWDVAGLNAPGARVMLKQVERQNDPVFIKGLNEVRLGFVSPEFMRILDGCHISRKPLPSNGIIPTKLYAVNKDVDLENSTRLAELPGEVETMRAQDRWVIKPVSKHSEQHLVEGVAKMIPDQIQLKVGAQVMLLRNRTRIGGGSEGPQLVNGSRGQILYFTDSVLQPGLRIPMVRFDNGMDVLVGPVEYEYKGLNHDGSIIREQIPLRLAW
jgi:ATP-dependent DNA helicase PIF1